MIYNLKLTVLPKKKKRCWFHRWETWKYDGVTMYKRCAKCDARSVEQVGGYQPIDLDFLNIEE